MPTLSYYSEKIQALLDAVNSATTDGNSIATERYVDTAVADALSDLRTLVLGAYPLGEATGNPATFTDGAAAPVKSLIAQITPSQSGSGDPSPDNDRPINVWTGINIIVSPTANAQDGTIYTRDFGGVSVRGGEVDLIAGTRKSNYYYRTLATAGSPIVGTYATRIQLGYSASYPVKYRGRNTFAMSDKFTVSYDNTIGFSANTTPAGYFIFPYSAYILVTFPRDVVATTAQAVAWFAEHPSHLLYELATPNIIQLEPIEIATLYGDNYISADTGDVTVQYRADPTLYIAGRLT